MAYLALCVVYIVSELPTSRELFPSTFLQRAVMWLHIRARMIVNFQEYLYIFLLLRLSGAVQNNTNTFSFSCFIEGIRIMCCYRIADAGFQSE